MKNVNTNAVRTLSVPTVCVTFFASAEAQEHFHYRRARLHCAGLLTLKMTRSFIRAHGTMLRVACLRFRGGRASGKALAIRLERQQDRSL
jgi:hypothetical protein